MSSREMRAPTLPDLRRVDYSDIRAAAEQADRAALRAAKIANVLRPNGRYSSKAPIKREEP